MKLKPETHATIARSLGGVFANMDADDSSAVIAALSDRLSGLDDSPEGVITANEIATAGEALHAAFAAKSGPGLEPIIKALEGMSEGGLAAVKAAIEHAANDDGEPAPEASSLQQGAEAMAASAGRSGAVARMAAAQAAPAGSPEQRPADSPGRPVLVAQRPMGDLVAGAVIESREQLSHGLAAVLRRLAPEQRGNGVVLCASASWSYPPERKLGSEAYENTRLMEEAVGVEAVIASGGICAPVNVDYTVDTWATAERPLRDGLPAFEATRGGLRFVKPKDIAALEGATGIWTEATDAEPGSATKPVLAVSCGTPEEVLVEAVSTRLGFGNMQARFAPEQVAMNTDLAMAAAARKAEVNLLKLIQAVCLKDVTSAKVLGATRDLLTAIHQAAAAFRYTHRISRKLMLTGIFPDFVLDLIKTDLARETAHQQGTDWNALEIKVEQAEALIRNAGINPIFTLDGLPEEAGKYPLQGFASQTGTGAIHAFPTKVVWNLFPEGSLQFLDGGRLDLGVVRDSTLDATNDYETFVETFEGIADRGFENAAIQFVTELCADGSSGATSTAAESSCA
jgi:hypothetical protein